MAVWLVGLIVLFFFYALCVLAAKREPKSETGKWKMETGEAPAAFPHPTARTRRRDRERIVRTLNAEGRTEVPEEIRAA